jgi:23S rRNA (guanosine2251-2'-O)-methyltransferase
MAPGDLIIGGVHAVLTAFERVPLDCLELWLKRDHDSVAVQSLAVLAEQHGVSVQLASTTTLDKLYGDNHHQGVVLRRRAPPIRPLKEVLSVSTDTGPAPLLLVLDAVQDPRNFGACLRVADGAGITAVIYPRDNSARPSNAMAKAASGAMDTVALVAVPNLAAAMRELQKAGIWITGAAHDAPKSLYDIDFSFACALVLGNEGSGLRRLTREHCDHLAHIPMSGGLASLNVASAAAVFAFEARRQRLAPSDA